MAETAISSDMTDADESKDWWCRVTTCVAHFPEEEQLHAHLIKDHSLDDHLDGLSSYGPPDETG